MKNYFFSVDDIIHLPADEKSQFIKLDQRFPYIFCPIVFVVLEIKKFYHKSSFFFRGQRMFRADFKSFDEYRIVL